jgi:hypothetical protein
MFKDLNQVFQRFNMSDFQWQKHHLEWFLKTFKNETREISRGDVEKRYRPKKGEPKKGKSKNGERTITPRDFGDLMRQMVRSHHARVTWSHSGSERYRIKMVSEDYPYSQEYFDREIFENPFMQNPIPEKEELLKNYLPNAKIDWNDKIQGIWLAAYVDGRKYLASFDIYNYFGGDFDLVFSTCAYYGIDMDLTSDDKELFILQSNLFIRLYEVFKLGNEELVAEYNKQTDSELLYTATYYNSVFISSFQSDIIKWFLLAVERPTRKISDRTYYDNAVQVLQSYKERESTQDRDSRKSHQRNINDFMKPLLGRFSPSDEALYYCSNEDGKNWRRILAQSDRPELKDALYRAEEAYRELEKFKVRCYRPRCKNVGNVSV